MHSPKTHSHVIESPLLTDILKLKVALVAECQILFPQFLGPRTNMAVPLGFPGLHQDGGIVGLIEVLRHPVCHKNIGQSVAIQVA